MASQVSPYNSAMRATAKRWFDWLLLLIAGVLVCLLLYPLLRSLAFRVDRFCGLWPAWLVWLMALGLSSAVVVGVRNLGGLGPRHFLAFRFLRFPPTWLAGPIGTAVYLWLASLTLASAQQVPLAPADFGFRWCFRRGWHMVGPNRSGWSRPEVIWEIPG